jgi:hypothetical protein
VLSLVVPPSTADDCVTVVPLLFLQAVKFIDELMAMKTEKLGNDVLLAAARTSMGSKIVGAESDYFSQLVVDAIQSVRSEDAAVSGSCQQGRGKRLTGEPASARCKAASSISQQSSGALACYVRCCSCRNRPSSKAQRHRL